MDPPPISTVKEQVTVNLRIAGVLPYDAFAREAAFVQLDLLKATEDYRDGRGSKAFGSRLPGGFVI